MPVDVPEEAECFVRFGLQPHGGFKKTKFVRADGIIRFKRKAIFIFVAEFLRIFSLLCS